MARLAGVDLAGWHDAACCNYDLASGDAAAEPVTVDGGIGSVVVDMTADGVTRAIAGPQAILSPVGRGGGWGPIGAPHLRRSLRDVWANLLGGAGADASLSDFSAGVAALATGAERVLFCVPDRPEMDERRQQALLKALAGRGRPRPTLLWRSVAVLLDALDGGHLPRATAGLAVVVLSHETDGIDVQRFVLRGLETHAGLLAPERAAVGAVAWPDWGLAPLLAHLAQRVNAANPVLAQFGADTPRLPLMLVLDEPPFELPEIIRRDNGDWLQINAPADLSCAPVLIDHGPVPTADVVLLTTPLAGHHCGRLEADIRRAWPDAGLVILGHAASARGALRAADRIGRDIPHYLDRLDPIALAVMQGETPVFADLIPRDATVPGNKEYVSEPITSLVWAAGMTHAKFFIRKGEHEIRRWQTPDLAPPATPQPLLVHLRQTPAQGWATLTVTSPTWEPLRLRPIVLDWNSPDLTVDPRSAEEILASLEKPQPVVPRRIRHEPHIGLWTGELRRPGLLSALAGFDANKHASLKPVVAALRASFRVREEAEGGGVIIRQVYAVGTDGEVPPEATEADVICLDRVRDVVAARISAAVATRQPQGDNDLLLTATWMFGRCPIAVQTVLADAYYDDQAGRPHPLLQARQSRKALIHGLGRCVSDGALAVRLIRALLYGAPSTDALGAASALLSRPVATPVHLDDEDLSAITELLLRLFRSIRRERSFGVQLKYALLCTAGLLRIRERFPGALVATTSGEAAQLRDAIQVLAEQVTTYVDGATRPAPGRTAKLAIMRDLVEYLNGTGGSPDILTNVEALGDGDGDGDNGDT